MNIDDAMCDRASLAFSRYEWDGTGTAYIERMRAALTAALSNPDGYTCQCNPVSGYVCPACGRCYQCHKRNLPEMR